MSNIMTTFGTLKHIKSGNSVKVNEVLFDAAPYATISHRKYELIKQEDRENIQKHIESIGKNHFDGKMIMMSTYAGVIKSVGVMILKEGVTWEEMFQKVKQGLKDENFSDVQDITNVGYSWCPLVRPSISKVVDVTKQTPYEAFPDYAIVYVTMFQRRTKWRPLAVGLCVCNACGCVEAQNKKLKTCCGCREVKYCSKECQAADWKHHKNNCKK